MRTRIAAAIATTATGVALCATSAAYAAQPGSRPHVSVQVSAPSQVSADVACASFCGWDRTRFRGGHWNFRPRHNVCYDLSPGGAHSVENHTGHTVWLFSRRNCRGSYYYLSNYHYDAATPFQVRSMAR